MDDINKLYCELAKLGDIQILRKKTGYYINNPHYATNYFDIINLGRDCNLNIKKTEPTEFNGHPIPRRLYIYPLNKGEADFFNKQIKYQKDNVADNEKTKITELDYSQMILAINNEIALLSSKKKQVTLQDGKLIKTSNDRTTYEFPIDNKIYKLLGHVEECDVIYNKKTYFGSITGLKNNRVKLFINDNLGDNLELVIIEWIPSKIYQMMKKRIEENKNKNKDFKHLLLFPNSGEVVNQYKLTNKPICNKNVNDIQLSAITESFKNKLSFIWGPPGTGKTSTISHIASNLVKMGKNVLFVSNTNRAVDVGLINIIDDLTNLFSTKLVDKITRYGAPFIEDNEDLDAIYFENQLDKEKEERKKKIKLEIDNYDKYVKLKKEKVQFEETLLERKTLQTGIDALKKQINKEEKKLKESSKGKSDLNKNVSKIFESPSTSNEEKISIEKKLISIQTKIASLKKNLDQSKSNLETLEKSLSSKDIKLILDQFNKISKWVEDFGGENALITFINKTLNIDIKKFFKSKLLVGATIARVITNNILFEREYDVLIVDESSMIGITHLLILASLVKETMIFAGDPRQLPPIVLSRDEVTKKWMGTDIYTLASKASNEIDLFRWHEENKDFTFFLNKQYRMKTILSDFISANFYNNKLISCSDNNEEAIYFISTSNLNPTLNKLKLDPNQSSKGRILYYNPVHANKIIELLDYLFAEKKRPEDIGIICPINSAVINMRLQLENNNYNNVEVGTIHTYQGREKEIIIFDTVMSNVRHTIKPYDETATGDQVKRLLNVAFSRTKDQLFVICDVDHFEQMYKKQFIVQCFRRLQELSAYKSD